jgi:hypothetical protein
LLQNNGAEFVDVTAAAGIYSSKIAYGLSASVADFNQDSFPDIYVCNDFSENDYYYINQKDGTFKESVRELTGHTSNFSMGSDVGDFNGDRWPDLFTLDMKPSDESILKATMSADQPNVYNLKRELGYYDQLPHNALQWNRGEGHFSEIAALSGVAASDWSWSCLIEDFDLDGRQDIFVANGIERRPNSLDYLKFISSGLARRASNLEVIANMPGGHVANQVFRQTSEWSFEEAAKDWGLDLVGSSTGAAIADFDQDGDADLVLNNLNAPATIYENTYKAGPRSQGAVFNPSGAGPRRYDANRQLCPQRGMMSQSEGRYGPDRGAAGKYPNRFTSQPSGIVRSATPGSYFDKEPLALYAPAATDYPVLWVDGGIAVRTGNQQEYQVYQWDGDSLEPGEKLAIRALMNSRQVVMPDKPLRANFSAEKYTLFAEEFGGLQTWQGGDAFTGLRAPTGLWQTVALVYGTGGAGTKVIAGNWGLNSTLGTPTRSNPVRLYEVDIDNNGKEESLVTYVRNGKEVTVADKDELAGQIPSLRRNNLNYTDFANRSFAENFPGLQVQPKTASSFHHLMLTRLNGSNWTVDTLPLATQITTVNCALEMEQGILLGGNKTKVLPRIGRQDAAALQLLTPNNKVEFIDLGGRNNRLEIRQMVRLDDNHVLLVVAEGEHLILGW